MNKLVNKVYERSFPSYAADVDERSYGPEFRARGASSTGRGLESGFDL